MGGGGKKQRGAAAMEAVGPDAQRTPVAAAMAAAVAAGAGRAVGWARVRAVRAATCWGVRRRGAAAMKAVGPDAQRTPVAAAMAAAMAAGWRVRQRCGGRRWRGLGPRGSEAPTVRWDAGIV